MLAAHAKHPNCAYKWVNWVSSPKVQAEQAISFGETPANTKACPYMEQIKKGSCMRVSRERAERLLRQHQVLEDAGEECGNGKNDCMDYSAWQQKWTEVTG